MGRIGITYSDVAKAADQLTEQGLRPTVDAVRAQLGTGSKSTIVPHLRRWRSKQEKDSPVPDLAFVNGIQDFYRQAQSELEDNLNALKTEIQELTSKNAALLKTIRHFEHRENQLTNQRQLLSRRVFKLEKEIQRLQKQRHLARHTVEQMLLNP